jgi:hypothetical protein
MQQEQQAHEVNMAAAQGMNGGGEAPGQGAPDASAQPEQPQSEHPEGSELDQHIAKLESMIAKSEILDPKEMKKSMADCLQGLSKFQKSLKEASDLRKSQATIKGIAKALHKPAFKMSKQASINLNENAKQAVSMQHKIVSDVMEKMEQEEKRASKDIQALVADLTKA